ncbi:carotenoid oxygenase family protein [Nocardia sp. CDC159]|uniref:Dioxygenase n=1 Tax=Nocardia pulmonis TaxID=2951408 RepID=A0A9X2EAG9_9NOCA|nr:MULTISPECIES: carotenoid oxygenase family protein [Nocardia]MCM6776764.1 carotenoid oxygenase family protein [Nocardia pulmonis]MCM6789087.1 carotenoid oxygenase family protein [Nocardia sp. CDC159]
MGNRYLEGAFAPIEHEYTLTGLRVSGTIPAHLDGRYLRNGPNPVGELDPALYHWFIGDGMVHGVRLRDGRAEWYRNRWVRGPATARALGEQPPPGLDHAWGPGANTNVIGHAGRTLALVEAGLPNYELDEELDTVGICDFDGTLPGGYTAHPKRDPETGELHAVSYTFRRGNKVQYSVIGADGRARRVVDIEVGGAPMMHDLSLTENYVVFYDLPVTFDVRQAAEISVPRLLRWPARLILSAMVGRVPIPNPPAARQNRVSRDRRLPYRWDPKYQARLGVMPRSGDNADVRWFDIEPCYVYHPMNAYEDGNTIVLDVVRHPKMFDTDLTGPNEGAPTLDRWEIDLDSGKVRQGSVDDRPQEFPRVDERLTGRRHRYGYAPGIRGGLAGGGELYKHDLVGASTAVRSFGPGTALGEFVFEPARPDAAEDEGVLMGFVYDSGSDTTDLAILDAGTLEDVARVHLPVRVPAGFHGNWVPTT